jgi:hypothetical protein
VFAPSFACLSVHCLPGVLLLLLVAVANATPLEILHLKGIQDGGDYDSIIQPLVLSLAGLAIYQLLAAGQVASVVAGRRAPGADGRPRALAARKPR